MKPSKKIRIGLTGGIATGKSQVSSFLRSKGYEVVDADKIARDVVKPGSFGLRQLRETFGEDIIESERLDREKLGKIVFFDKEARKKLDEILHPLIFREMNTLGDKYKGDVLFYDIPLLFETKETIEGEGLVFDEIWVVDTSMELRIRRLMERDSIDRKYAMAKIASQMTMEEKKSKADQVLNNDKDLSSLYKAVEKNLARILGDEDEG